MSIQVERERIERLLQILAQVALGDYDVRIRELTDDISDEFLELEVSFNMLLDELSLTRRRNAEQQQQIEQQTVAIADQQRELVRALSTPIIVVARGVLALPIIGAVEAERAQTMTEALLERVVSERATHVILDVTGAGPIAQGTAKSLLRLASAVQMIGARCLLTGISPAMAKTLVALDFDSTNLLTLPQLADALALVLGDRTLRRSMKSSDPTASKESAKIERTTHADSD